MKEPVLGGTGRCSDARVFVQLQRLSGLSDLSGFNARRAHLYPASAPLRQLHTNRLQVWIKSSRCAVIRVRDIVAELRSFAADFTTFGHYFCNLRVFWFPYSVSGIIQLVSCRNKKLSFIANAFLSRQAGRPEMVLWAVFIAIY